MSVRCVTDDTILRGNFDGKGNVDFSAAKFGICHECEKVNSSASKTNDIVSSKRETKLHNSTMSACLL